MRLMFISYFSVYERYIVKQLSRQFPLAHVVRLLEGQPPGSGRDWRQVVRRPLHKAGIFLTRPLRDRRDRRYDATGRERFSDCRLAELDAEVLEIPQWALRRPEGAALLEELEPDVVVVCSAPVLKREIYEIPRLACLNIHYGATPYYRGEHTLFWPLLREDYEHIGVTIHHVRRGIDTGAALVRGYPALDPDDDEFTLRVKAAELAARLLTDLLREFQRRDGPPPLVLPPPVGHGKGKLYRLHDRGLTADLRYLFKYGLLRTRPPRLPERIERCYLLGAATGSPAP